MGNRQLCCCDDNKGADFTTSRAIKINRRGPQYYAKKDPFNQSTMITYSKNYPPNPISNKSSQEVIQAQMKKEQSLEEPPNRANQRHQQENNLDYLTIDKQTELHKNLTLDFESQRQQLEKKQSQPDYFHLNRNHQNINDANILGIKDLNPNVKKTFENNKFFIVEDLKKKPIYYQTLPNGFYKYVRSDGSLYIGSFSDGKAHGRGIYIFTDGSYYEGMFRNDMADAYGTYFSKDLVYKGEFKQNTFQGKGMQKGPNHSYNGLYMNGLKYHGIFQWKDQSENQYTFKGSFDQQGRFFGQGILNEPTGVYQGNFKFGMKHGEGQYKFNNQYKYKGSYKNNVRQGPGKLLNPLGKIVFDGQFKEGLPVTQDLGLLNNINSLFNRKNNINDTKNIEE